MKLLWKGGILLALGWLSGSLSADEIQWKASAPKKMDAPAAPPASTGAAIIRVGVPTPLDGAPERGPASFRPISDGTGAVIRAQSADDKSVPPLPKLEIVVQDQAQPKPLPKDKNFTPPPPTPMGPPAPSPVFDSLGMGGVVMDGCGSCGDVCGSRCGSGPGIFNGCDCCQDRGRWWVSGEYLMWWQKGQSVPPLVTAGPNGPASPALGQPNTSVLYDNVANPMRSGGRFEVGYWFASCPNLGVEVNTFFLGRVTSTSTFTGNGSMEFGRPFFDVNNNVNSAENFSNNAQTGSASIHTYSQLWGMEGNLRYKLCCGPNYWLDLLVGYRHVDLSEGIDIYESTQPNVMPSIGFSEHESFHTRNEFNGVQIGLDGEARLWNRFFVGGFGKLAVGNVYEIVNIDGTTGFNVPPNPLIASSTQQGALLATRTNIGQHTQNRFGVMPEIGLKIGYDITDHLRVYVGYDFLYLSSVVRPGEQIDPNVNSNYRPSAFGPGVGGGVGQPAVLMRTNDYWAQGVNFGVMYRY